MGTAEVCLWEKLFFKTRKLHSLQINNTANGTGRCNVRPFWKIAAVDQPFVPFGTVYNLKLIIGFLETEL